MMRRGLLVGLAVAACGCDGPAPAPAAQLTLNPSIIVPDDLIGQIAVFNLKVFASKSEAGVVVGCDSTTGTLTGNPDAGKPEVNESSFSSQCEGGAERCTTGQAVPVSAAPQIFYVSGMTGGKLIAQGCTAFTIDPTTKDAAAIPEPISIKLIPFVPPATCGNGIVEVGETCDPPAGSKDPDCNACQTSEMVLSVPSASTFTVAGNNTSVSTPSFAWPAGGNFLASFTDRSSGLGQVELRVLDPMLVSDVTGAGPAENAEFILPNSASFPSMTAADVQQQPQTVIIGSIAYTVFADNTASPDFEIHLRSTDLSILGAQQSGPCGINGTGGGGETGDQTSPVVAVSNGNLFIAWQDAAGTLAGRTFTPTSGGSGACGASNLGPQTILGTGALNSNISVAGIPKGWVSVWQSGNNIQLQAINSAGGPVGTPAAINNGSDLAETPSIASITTNNGAFAVAWADKSSGNIVAQRYNITAAGTASSIGGDQGSAVVNNLHPGSASNPFIASSSLGGGSYIVTWVDNTAVRARLLNGITGSLQSSSGYLFNGMTGLTDEFQVSSASSNSHPHSNPVAVVGGMAPYMAFGWVDTFTTPPFGIIARRFPLPPQP